MKCALCRAINSIASISRIDIEKSNNNEHISFSTYKMRGNYWYPFEICSSCMNKGKKQVFYVKLQFHTYKLWCCWVCFRCEMIQKSKSKQNRDEKNIEMESNVILKWLKRCAEIDKRDGKVKRASKSCVCEWHDIEAGTNRFNDVNYEYERVKMLTLFILNGFSLWICWAQSKYRWMMWCWKSNNKYK